MKLPIAAPRLCLGPQIVGKPGQCARPSNFAMAIVDDDQQTDPPFPQIPLTSRSYEGLGSSVAGCPERSETHVVGVPNLSKVIVPCHLQGPVHIEAREMHQHPLYPGDQTPIRIAGGPALTSSTPPSASHPPSILGQ